MRRSVALFAVFAGLASLALFGVGLGERYNAWAAFQVERAVRIARSIGFAVTHPTSDADDDLQAFVDRVGEEVEGVEAALVLKNVRFLAHTNPERAGQRLDRDSLSDKALYDLAGRLSTTVRKNIEERERDTSLQRDAYAEYVMRDREGGFDLAAPAKSYGDYEALVYLRMAHLPRDQSLPWGVFLFGLGAVALFAGAVRFLSRPLLVTGVGGVLLALQLLAQAAWLVDWGAGGRVDRAATMATTYAALARAGLFEAATEPDEASVVHALGLTLDGRPEGALLGVQRGEVTQPGALALQADGYTVLMDEGWFARKRAQDAGDLALWTVGIGALVLLGFALGAFGQLTRGWRSVVRHRAAYGYLSPAMVGMLVLVFIPVVFGLALGFMQRRYNVFEFAGLANYWSILSDLHVTDPQNFYFKLGVTALWTGLNVSLHVSIGLFLALLLNDPMLKARGPLRVLLIVPWAVPNYITALIWKGMFHKQFGAVNFFLEAMGLEPVAWFQHFWPAFSTNVITNTWLGFPFMMVISLGALQSIPTDLYEAARVDGAGRWHRFRYVTLPLLMPALVPAVIVGTVWTFNMFNIIYLVSGGAPNGSTDILITDAFRWAFERDRYGYAAAYSTLIFFILLAFTLATNRITGATKGAFE